MLCTDLLFSNVIWRLQLPAAEDVKSEAMLRKLTAQPPDVKQWEVGGNCNFLIAAARLGLSVASIGNLGSDIYGDFVRQILKVVGLPDAVGAAQSPPGPWVAMAVAVLQVCVSVAGRGCGNEWRAWAQV